MNTFFNNNNTSDIGKLIHVGAGSGIELNDYIAQNFTEILLLEPIPKVFKHLESKIEKLNAANINCTISAVNVALSNTVDTADIDEERAFYITQPNRYSSFHKADKLKTLFQNLKTTTEITVNTISFSDLMQKAVLDKNKKNALVLQINGEECDVLAQAQTDELMQFSSIVIQQAKHNYFGRAKASSDVIKVMESKGFQLAVEIDNDVVFASLVFHKDEKTLTLKVLTEQSEIQEIRIRELENQLKASNEAKTAKATESSQLTEQNKNKATRIDELENQLKASNEAKTAKATESSQLTEQNKNKATHIAELENQLKASNEAKTAKATESSQLTEQNKNKATRIAELENQLKASNEAKTAKATESSQLTEQNKNKATHIAELENQLKASNEAKTAKASESSQLAEQNRNKATRIAELENQLKSSNKAKKTEVERLTLDNAETSRSAKLGQKMLAKAHVDLDDLRETYSEKLASETELVELVKELREKLTLASKYYYQLQQEHPELLSATGSSNTENTSHESGVQ